MPKIRIKRGTTSQWNSSTSPLLAGELGYDTVAKTIKIGDGTTLWSSLNPLNKFEIDEISQDAIYSALTNFISIGNNITVEYNDAENYIVLDTGPNVVLSNDLSAAIVSANEYTDTAVAGLGNSIDGQYVPVSSVGNPDGVAPLDPSGLIPDSYIPAGIARDSEIVTSYNDLSNLPTLFSGNYNDLTNRPNIALGAVKWTANHYLLPGGENTRYLAGDIVWDGGNIYVANYDNESLPTTNTQYWTSLGAGKRLNIDGRDIPNILWDNIGNKPTLFDGNYNSLSNLPTLFDGSYNSLSNLPTLFSGSYTDLTDKPTLFDGDYESLTNLPSLFSGSYNDLTDKPTIPSLTGYATETYVNTAVSNLVDSAPETLNTLNELAAALGDDANYATTISTALGNKLDSSTASSTYLTQSNASSTYAPIASPTFTGTVSGITSSMVGLGNVDNTSDANKPVSTATQTALNAKLDSSGFTYSSITIPVYTAVEDLPSAASNHGRWAHVHGEGAMYFAHGGAWYRALSESDLYVSVNSQSSSYTLSTSDLGKTIEMSGGGTLTISDSSSFPVGFSADVLQVGSSQVTIAGSGFTPNATPGLKLRTQWSSATLVKRDLNSWVILGDLSA